MRRALFISLFLLSTIFSPADAHLDKNSLTLPENESFLAGDEMTFTWNMTHGHNMYHFIYLRNDDDAEWRLIDSVEGDWSTLDFSYTLNIPEITTTSARIMVFLPEFSKTPSEETDDFTLISEPFSISEQTTNVKNYRGKRNGHALMMPESEGQTIFFDLSGRIVSMRQFRQSSGYGIIKKGIVFGRLRRF